MIERMETGQRIDLYPETVREPYQKALENYLRSLKLVCWVIGKVWPNTV